MTCVPDLLPALTWIDTHAHLLSAELAPDLPEVLERARRAGVGAVLCVCESLKESEAALELAAHHELVRACAGVHPDRAAGLAGSPAAQQALLREVDEVCRLVELEHGKLTAIGEVGLDHWRAQEPEERQLQQEMLARFVACARQTGLPLSIHSRSAGRQTLELLKQWGAQKVVMHAFDGKASSAGPGVEAGFFFSIPPSVARSLQKQKLVHRLPLDRLLLETDSPVLGADPTCRNEPANVRLAGEEVARLLGVTVKEVARVTTARACALFGLELPATGEEQHEGVGDATRGSPGGT